MNQTVVYVKRFFDIRHGELRISLWMMTYIFLIISALLVAKPTVSALFLSGAGSDALPFAFILVAATALITSLLYNRSLHSFKLNILIRATLFSSALIFWLFGALIFMAWTPTVLLFIGYIFISIFALLATSQFWILANVVFNAREAKRLFSFIGAGGIIGGIFGGYLTNVLASIIGNGGLLFLAGAFVLGCIPILGIIWKNRPQAMSSYKRKAKSTVSSESSFKLIRKSKHLTYLAGIIGTGVLVAKLVDYQFSAMAVAQFPDPAQLAAFFGFWFSTFNVLSLVIQLAFTRRFLDKQGITNSLLLLPAGIILAGAVLFIFPELWVVVILKGLDGSLKQSLYKASAELLQLPIPLAIKNKTKTFIDVVVDSIATGLAGGLLILLVDVGSVDIRVIAGITLALSALWIYLIFKVRFAYLRTFKMSILKVEGGRRKKSLSRKLIIKNMLHIFEHGDEADIVRMLKRVPEFSSRTFYPALVRLLKHPNHRVRAEAVRNLRHVDAGKPVVEVSDLIHEENDEVVLATMEYMLAHDDRFGAQFFETYLDHDSDYISTAALLCLARESENNIHLAGKYNLELRLDIEIQHLHQDELRRTEIFEILETVARSNVRRFYPVIQEYLDHERVDFRRKAILAAGLTGDPRFVQQLIDLLDVEELQNTAAQALAEYGTGIIKHLNRSMENLTLRQRQAIPDVLLDIESNRAALALVRLTANASHSVRVKAARALKSKYNRNPDVQLPYQMIRRLILQECEDYKPLLDAYYSLQIGNAEATLERDKITQDRKKHVIAVLRKHLTDRIERLFILLALRYNYDDLEVAFQGITSENSTSQANALELLNGILKANMKSNLLPILETSTMSMEQDDKVILSRIVLRQPDDYINILLNTRHAKLLVATLDYLEMHDLPGHRDHILSLQNRTKFKSVAVRCRELLEQLDGHMMTA